MNNTYNGLPLIEFVIDGEDLVVDAVAIVDAPAIKKNFQTFANTDKVSIDYDETLSTERGKELAKRLIDEGKTIYIISARDSKDGMLSTAKELGIPESRVFATGSNKAKIEKVTSLDISKHYDNNSDVIKELGSIGEKFADTYNDYPQAAVENAKTALRWAEKNGWGECGTPVGKQRANQLANKESLSRETIARMAAFERHRQNSDKELGDGCGRLMWLAWGGDEGIAWAQKKLEQIDKQTMISQFAIQDEERRIISGVLMMPDTPIYRNDKIRGEYYCTFSKDTIEQIAVAFFDKGFQKNVNFMHDGNIIDGFVLFESFISDSERGINPMKGFEDTPDGSWFGSMKVMNDEAWQLVKSGKFKGFSVEGAFGVLKDEFYSDLEDLFSKFGSI